MDRPFLLCWYAVFLLSAFLFFILDPWWGMAGFAIGSAGIGIVLLRSMHGRLKTTVQTSARGLNFDRYVSDITHIDTTSYKENSLVGRKEEFRTLEVILGRPEKKSALVVGDPGIGKSVFLYAVVRARRKRAVRSLATSAPSLLVLDLEKAWTHAVGSPTEKEHFLHALFEEIVSRGRAIVIVENAEKFLGPLAHQNFSRLLCQYAEYPGLSLLLSLRPGDYHEAASQDELNRAFEIVFLRKPDQSEVLEIVQSHFQPLAGGTEFFTPEGKRAWQEAVERLHDHLPSGSYHEQMIRFGEDLVLFLTESQEKRITGDTVRAFLKTQTLLPQDSAGMPALSFRNIPGQETTPAPHLTFGMKMTDLS